MKDSPKYAEIQAAGKGSFGGLVIWISVSSYFCADGWCVLCFPGAALLDRVDLQNIETRNHCQGWCL